MVIANLSRARKTQTRTKQWPTSSVWYTILLFTSSSEVSYQTIARLQTQVRRLEHCWQLDGRLVNRHGSEIMYSGGGFFFGETSTHRVGPFQAQVTTNHNYAYHHLGLHHSNSLLLAAAFPRQEGGVWVPEEGSLSDTGDFFLERFAAGGFDFWAPTSGSELSVHL